MEDSGAQPNSFALSNSLAPSNLFPPSNSLAPSNALTPSTPERGRLRIKIRCDICTVQKKGCFIYEGESTCTKCIERGKTCTLQGVPVGIQQQRNFDGPGPREKATEQPKMNKLPPLRPKATANPLSSRAILRSESRSESSAQPNFNSTSGKSVSTSKSPHLGAAHHTMASDRLDSSQRIVDDNETGNGTDDNERPMKYAKYTHHRLLVKLPCCIDESGRACFMSWGKPIRFRGTTELEGQEHGIASSSLSRITNAYIPSHHSPLAGPLLTTSITESQNRRILCCDKIGIQSDELRRNNEGSKLLQWAKQNSGLEAKEFAGWDDTAVWGNYKHLVTINTLPNGTGPRQTTYVGCKSLAKHDFVEISLDDPDAYPETVTKFDLKNDYYDENAKYKGKACLVLISAALHMQCDIHSQKFTVGEVVYYPAFSSIHRPVLPKTPPGANAKDDHLNDGIQFESAGPLLTKVHMGMGLHGSGFNVCHPQLSGNNVKGKERQATTDFSGPTYHPEHFAESRGFIYDQKTNTFTIPNSRYDLARQYPSAHSNPEPFFDGNHAAPSQSFSECFNGDGNAEPTSVAQTYQEDTYTLGDEYRLENPIDWSLFPGPQLGQPNRNASDFGSLPHPGGLDSVSPPPWMRDYEDLGEEILEPDDLFGDAFAAVAYGEEGFAEVQEEEDVVEEEDTDMTEVPLTQEERNIAEADRMLAMGYELPMEFDANILALADQMEAENLQDQLFTGQYIGATGYANGGWAAEESDRWTYDD